MGWFAKLLTRLRKSETGVAAVEFALIFPAMLALYVGAVEGSTLFIVDRKVQSVSGTIGDLVARSDGSISTDTLRSYFRVASGVMMPYSSNEATQTVTAVSVDAAGNTSVLWSSEYRYGSYYATTTRVVGRPFTQANGRPLPTEMLNISRSKTVIVAEASYSILPVFGIVIQAPVNLYRSNFYLPRFGGTITRTN